MTTARWCLYSHNGGLTLITEHGEPVTMPPPRAMPALTDAVGAQPGYLAAYIWHLTMEADRAVNHRTTRKAKP